MVDDGPAIHYSAVPRGTPVYDANGNEIGTVDRVMDNYRENILDGFVIRMPKHGLRFVDAPEVARSPRPRPNRCRPRPTAGPCSGRTSDPARSDACSAAASGSSRR
jgi:hypothetical protein